MAYKVLTQLEQPWNPEEVCSFRVWHPLQGWRAKVTGYSPEEFCKLAKVNWNDVRAVKVNVSKALRLINWMEPDKTAPQFDNELYAELKARF